MKAIKLTYIFSLTLVFSCGIGTKRSGVENALTSESVSAQYCQIPSATNYTEEGLPGEQFCQFTVCPIDSVTISQVQDILQTVSGEIRYNTELCSQNYQLSEKEIARTADQITIDLSAQSELLEIELNLSQHELSLLEATSLYGIFSISNLNLSYDLLNAPATTGSEFAIIEVKEKITQIRIALIQVPVSIVITRISPGEEQEEEAETSKN